jgi:hypothetical protein
MAKVPQDHGKRGASCCIVIRGVCLYGSIGVGGRGADASRGELFCEC